MRTIVVSSALLVFVGTRCFAAMFALQPSADTSLFRDIPMNSNGAGGIFVGNTSSAPDGTRRGLVRFDLAVLPSGSIVRSATLSLHVERSVDLPNTIHIHRLLESWGESTSEGPGSGAPAATDDATWINRFVKDLPQSSIPWSNSGGTFVAGPSASALAEDGGTTATWQGATLGSDADGWLAAPASNAGWILIGDESRSRTARRFSSRESATIANRPTLNLNLRIGGDANNDDHVNFDDLLLLAQNYNASAGATFDTGDFTRDAAVGFDDLLILAQNYDPNALGSADPNQVKVALHADWRRPRVLVPEPITIIGIVALGIAARRRRCAEMIVTD